MELLRTNCRYRIRPQSKRAQTPNLIQEKPAQLRIEVLRPRFQIIEAATELEFDDGKTPSLVASRRGTSQLVDHHRKATHGRLRLSIMSDRRYEITPALHGPVRVAISNV